MLENSIFQMNILICCSFVIQANWQRQKKQTTSILHIQCSKPRALAPHVLSFPRSKTAPEVLHCVPFSLAAFQNPKSQRGMLSLPQYQNAFALFTVHSSMLVWSSPWINKSNYFFNLKSQLGLETFRRDFSFSFARLKFFLFFSLLY